MIGVRPVSSSRAVLHIVVCLIQTFGLLRSDCCLPRFVNAENCPHRPNNGNQTKQFWE
jgi:hypothetical protein